MKIKPLAPALLEKQARIILKSRWSHKYDSLTFNADSVEPEHCRLRIYLNFKNQTYCYEITLKSGIVSEHVHITIEAQQTQPYALLPFFTSNLSILAKGRHSPAKLRSMFIKDALNQVANYLAQRYHVKCEE